MVHIVNTNELTTHDKFIKSLGFSSDGVLYSNKGLPSVGFKELSGFYKAAKSTIYLSQEINSTSIGPLYNVSPADIYALILTSENNRHYCMGTPPALPTSKIVMGMTVPVYNNFGACKVQLIWLGERPEINYRMIDTVCGNPTITHEDSHPARKLWYSLPPQLQHVQPAQANAWGAINPMVNDTLHQGGQWSHAQTHQHVPINTTHHAFMAPLAVHTPSPQHSAAATPHPGYHGMDVGQYMDSEEGVRSMTVRLKAMIRPMMEEVMIEQLAPMEKRLVRNETVSEGLVHQFGQINDHMAYMARRFRAEDEEKAEEKARRTALNGAGTPPGFNG